jgi:hypothetical protein
MRRLTLAILALGCLALGLAAFGGPSTMSISVPVLAAPPTEPTSCTRPCSFGDPEASDKDDHFAFCHVDHGGAAHVICPDSSSINHPHLDTHEFDFCINSATDLGRCAKNIG